MPFIKILFDSEKKEPSCHTLTNPKSFRLMRIFEFEFKLHITHNAGVHQKFVLVTREFYSVWDVGKLNSSYF